jgi:hypothetical protein
MYRLNYVSLFGVLNHVPVGDTWREQDQQAVHEELRKVGKTHKPQRNYVNDYDTDISHLVDAPSAEDSEEPVWEGRKTK